MMLAGYNTTVAAHYPFQPFTAKVDHGSIMFFKPY